MIQLQLQNETRAVLQIGEERNDMQELQSTKKTITAATFPPTTFPPTTTTPPQLTTTTTTWNWLTKSTTTKFQRTTTTPLPTTAAKTTLKPTTTTTNTSPPTTTTTTATGPPPTTTTTTTPPPTATTTTTPPPTTTTTTSKPPPTKTTTTTPSPTKTTTITSPPTTTTATTTPLTTTTTTPPPTTTTTTTPLSTTAAKTTLKPTTTTTNTSPPTTTTTTATGPPPTLTTTTTPTPTATTTTTPPPTTTTTTSTPPPTTTATTTPSPTKTTTITSPPTTTTATTTPPTTTTTTTTTPPPTTTTTTTPLSTTNTTLLDCSGDSGQWRTGDGHGTGDIEHGPYTITGRTDCFERCLRDSQTAQYPEVNGVTYNPATSQCYCETRMLAIDGSQSYESCLFKKVVIPPYYASCTYLPGVGYGLQNTEIQPQPTVMSDGEHCSRICLVKQLVINSYVNTNAAKFNPTTGQCRCQNNVLVIGNSNYKTLTNWTTCFFKEPPVTYTDCGNWSNISVNVTSNSQGVLENHMYSRHDCYVLCGKIQQAENYVGVMYDGYECWCLKTNTLASSPSNSTQICYWP